MVTGKTPFFVIDLFCTPHSICFSIGLWQGSFIWKYYGFNLSTFNLKLYSSFLKRVFVFQKVCFKLRVVTMLKISSDYHINAWSKANLKIPSVGAPAAGLRGNILLWTLGLYLVFLHCSFSQWHSSTATILFISFQRYFKNQILRTVVPIPSFIWFCMHLHFKSLLIW